MSLPLALLGRQAPATPAQRIMALAVARFDAAAPAGELPTFGRWLALARPGWRWDYRHFRVIQAALDEITAGTLTRLLLQIPIRHGKTEQTTISYPAHRIERAPGTRFLICSYNQLMADKFSREIRKLVRARRVPLSDDRDSAREWETAAGGGVRALGAGSGAASLNADVIIVDDPLGSREDAESVAMRDRTWDWLTNDVLARTEPHTAVIVQASRWHKDDPPGRILDQQAGRWRVIDLPARAEAGDALGRAVDEPLWPELRDDAWLTEKRAELGEYGFASLLQGRPRPREGGMFKWAWWQLLEAVPLQGPMVRYWDLAGTAAIGGNDPDFTCGALLCRMLDNRTAVVDVARFRQGVAHRDASMEQVCRDDLAAYRGRVRWWIETEAGIQGKERTATLVRRLQALGMPVYTEHPTGSKVDRAEPLASKAEAGNVVLCPGAWRDTFRGEAADFPNGSHDDQIDAAAGADAKLDVPTPTVTPLTLRF